MGPVPGKAGRGEASAVVTAQAKPEKGSEARSLPRGWGPERTVGSCREGQAGRGPVNRGEELVTLSVPIARAALEREHALACFWTWQQT